jgi:hypothetical protein
MAAFLPDRSCIFLHIVSKVSVDVSGVRMNLTLIGRETVNRSELRPQITHLFDLMPVPGYVRIMV